MKKISGMIMCGILSISMLTTSVCAAPVFSNLRFDGTTFVTGDPIAARPTITVRVLGTTIDANAFVVRIDGVQVSTTNPVNNFSYSGVDLSMQVPSRLIPGVHTFSVYALDTADGLGATTTFNAEVRMWTQETVGDPLAIPNPATSNMRITYTLTQPGEVYISIYNLNADKVWEQQLSQGMPGTTAGYNEVVWNLKSGYGDECPNGAYLCVITKKGDDNRVAMGKVKLFILR